MSLGRIILKSTTKISLNDRFTVLRKENPAQQSNGYATENRQLVQASRKNQRIAAQMERRPAVMAALKFKKGPINVGGSRPNLNQNRLNLNQNRLNVNQKVSVKQRLALPGRLRIPETSQGSARGARRGFANIKIRGGISNRDQFQGRIGTTNIRGGASFRGRGRGGFMGSRGGGINQRGRGMQGGRGIGRGRGFSRGRGAIFRNGT